MTIAMCYVSPEGVVLGADSTSSLMTQPGIFHFFNHNQKIFQLGERSTIGVLTWGLGGIGAVSHRSLLSELTDSIEQNPPIDLNDVATRAIGLVQPAYTANVELNTLGNKCRALALKRAHVDGELALDMRTAEEDAEFFGLLDNLTFGFCFAGHVAPSRTPGAVQVMFGPLISSPTIVPVPVLSYAWWGVPNLIKRLIWGYDEMLEASIINSKKWAGSEIELRAILDTRKLDHAILPIRDAVDFVHACIYSTIKGMKFSNLAQVCGGPIEIAVITTDRRFRWVRHKAWDAAMLEGEHYERGRVRGRDE